MYNQPDCGLEFLLGFDGRIHHPKGGYWLKFEIKRVEVTKRKPHELSYSFTLHVSDGTRMIGFDNAHNLPATGSRFKRRPETQDHWHRGHNDPGRTYQFKDAETLIYDFFSEVERALNERGAEMTVTAVEETRRPK